MTHLPRAAGGAKGQRNLRMRGSLHARFHEAGVSALLTRKQSSRMRGCSEKLWIGLHNEVSQLSKSGDMWLLARGSSSSGGQAVTRFLEKGSRCI
jgi:hypothetical protein